MTDTIRALPKSEPKELAWALRERANFINAESSWTTFATVAMMREAADVIDVLSERPRAATSDGLSGTQAEVGGCLRCGHLPGYHEATIRTLSSCHVKDCDCPDYVCVSFFDGLRQQQAAHASLVQEMEPYLQHKAECELLTQQAVSITCPYCDGTGRAKDSQHQMKDGSGKPWPENNCAPCAGSRNHEWLKWPDCTCGLALLHRSTAPGTNEGK